MRQRDVVVDSTATRDAFEFVVETPGIGLEASDPDEFLIQIPGFPARSRAAGVPDLPYRIFRVAIPERADPSLDIEILEEHFVPGVLPAPVAFEVFDVPPAALTDRATPDGLSEAVRRPEELRRTARRVRSPSVYGSSVVFPAAAAEIIGTGRLRGQRYASIRVTPVRFDPESGGLLVADRIAVRVGFGGVAVPEAVGASVEAAVDTVFESGYRRAFVNYGQGLAIRSSARVEAEYASATARSTGALDPLAPVHKIRVREHAIVRLDATALAGSAMLSEPLSTWKVLSRGAEVPIEVRDLGSDGFLDGADWIQFEVVPLTEGPKTVLNTDLSGSIDLWEYRDVSDEAIYFLTVDAVGTRSRVGVRDGAPTFSRVPPAEFDAVARAEVDDAWRPLGSADPWYWSPTLTDGGVTDSRVIPVALPGLASSTGAVTTRANLRGLTESAAVNPDHRTTVRLRNSSGQVLASDPDDGSFDGRTLYLHEFAWVYGGTGPTLTEPAEVVIEASPGGSPSHQVIADWVEIVYPRSFTAIGDVLEFRWPDENTEFRVSGFTSADVSVYEFTDAVDGTVVQDAVRIENVDVSGGGPFEARFRVDQDPGIPDGTLRRFVVFAASGTTTPGGPDLVEDPVSDLRDTGNQADLIVVAHPDVLDDPANCTSASLQALLAHRASQGISSRVACIEDVQDEFNHGHPGPEAIRGFLRFVLSDAPGEGWADPRPSMVLLLGDGSYDTRGGTTSGEFVPTQVLFKDDPQIGYYASDNELATVLGDDRLADVVVGRLSARDVAQADTMLGKILDYEVSRPDGAWRSHALFVSDRGKNFDVGEALEFERINDDSESYMARPPYTSTKLRYWTDYNGTQTLAIRQDLKDEVNGASGPGGVSLMQFIGHGNFDLWSDDVMYCGNEGSPFCPVDDNEDLVNGLQLPWLIVHNCLTGGFHTTAAKTMGESWIRRDGGGSIGVYAPSGLGFRYIGEVVTDVIWGATFGNRKERSIGSLVLESQIELCGQNSIEACQYYVFLGDPATTLQLPDVSPPTGPVATGGNGQVTLSWTASATSGATYDVYRSIVPGGTYARVNGAPVAGASFEDTGVTNATEYFYYVVAQDPSGFESRWSNFNSDCDVDGPDCVKATPLNPIPPDPPSGVQVTDPETGGALEVAWAANSEDDVTTYSVEYSATPGCHDEPGCTPMVENGIRTTSTVLRGLDNGVEYFVVVLATNTSGLTSDRSIETSAIPNFVRGIKAPDTIRGLRVDRSGDDAVLTWGAVLVDLYGKATAVDRYEVYRGTSPDFEPDPANRIASVGGTTFQDVGAASAAVPAYYWKVRAVDDAGHGGGLGRQLPAGIDNLGIARGVSAGDYDLSWTAVTTDFDGDPTEIDRYEVYVSDLPFGRAAICDPLTPSCVGPAPRATTTVPSITLPLGENDRFIHVFVVDRAGNLSPY